MQPDQTALLIADVGSVTTKVFLVDVVNDFYRVIGRTELPSTLEPPHADCTLALIAGAREIEQLTGRTITQGDQILTPYKPDGSGVDTIMVSTSAAGSMPVVVAAVAGDTSGASARRAIRSTYTTLLGTISLDDRTDEIGMTEVPWVERQVQALTNVRPRLVVLAGGVEGGAETLLVRLARLLSLTVLAPRGKSTMTPVLFAGNSAARQAVSEALQDVAPVSVVENVRPAIEQEQLAPLQRTLVQLYHDTMLSEVPGLAKLRAWSMYHPRSSAEGYAALARFMAGYYQRRVLLVDVGASSTSCYLADADSVSPVVLGDVGVSYGAPALLGQVGAASISRWLPFELSDEAVTIRVLNQALRPQLLPSSTEDLLFSQALAREALRLAFAELRDMHPQPEFDVVLATGGVFSHAAHPAQAAMILLDALEIGGTSFRATDLYIDNLGLLPACGVLAQYNADAAFCLLDQDILRGGALGTLVTAVGNAKAGAAAVDAEIKPQRGEPQAVAVMPGEIRRLPLPRGRIATVSFRPSSGVRIGGNEPGGAIEDVAVTGSTLGVIIDARGHPLTLPEDGEECRRLMRDWMVSLSGMRQATVPVERPSAAEQPAGAPQPEAQTQSGAGQAPLPPWLSEPDSQTDVPGGVQDLEQLPSQEPDLSELRQALQEQPKKRRLFGRR